MGDPERFERDGSALPLTLDRRSFLCAGLLLGSSALVGCGQPQAAMPADGEADAAASSDAAEPQAESASEAEPSASGERRVIVAYFSRADENYAGGSKEWLEVGHTKVMAGYLVEALGADEYEIVPETPYPEGYDECCDVALEEQRSDARPQIATAPPDLSGYDTVLIGCPVWWGDEPMIVRTFVEGVDLSGKTVVPFTTHGGSGLGNVATNLRTALPDASFLDGHAVMGTAVDGARDEVVGWAQGLGLV